MLDRGAQLDFIDLNKGLSEAELEKLIGKRDYREFLNPRNNLYRELGMKENPPPRKKAIQLMAENPNLIRRPLAKKGNTLLLGFDAKALGNLVNKR